MRPRTGFRRSAAAILLLLLAWLVPATASAQLTSGTIQGFVKDETGASVPGADVTITHIETGVARALVTNDVGRFEAPNLQVGT